MIFSVRESGSSANRAFIMMYYLNEAALNPVVLARTRPRERGRKTTGIKLNAL
ncbi:hypothetical protein ALP66_102409 [Pseudomonas amygdali pv. photiniae]|uniref:Uncharacterized protein n=6 Tax=Pseudomonas syringae group TaxID=136849 RepID=A0A3M6AW40_PSESS|nr:hypothetical protein PSYAE_09469 [Pseudomonas amygdali pv. aesculi str. 0893_23]KPW06095.1 hypothetical protein ALO90_102211 [Pseudomonas amygdali pv. aesculi]KPW68211.1 hypothetical protein ALO78_101876 [Pseudomonas amygdali pv. ciccaronei]KPW95660.1 hypothetical protein ALO79_100523 [Pseudomonas syringae pv. castaneae]KPX03469.1 hypothetical protein ALO74_102123 [Pseudomonas syringae pv. cunninghamiae]KPX09172.1 hypothetical protein ALO73_102251 [Pseudomonas syringae pv. daphniphylli]KPX